MTISGAWQVAGILEDICKRAGVPAFSVDFIEGAADGYSTTNEHSAVTALDDLAQFFLFDLSSHGGKLHFVPRAGEPVLALTNKQLTEAPKEKKRGDSIRIPKLLQLSYFDSEGGLTADMQSSDRALDSRSKDVKKLETSILMSADSAAQAVVIRHKIIVEEARGEVSFKLPDSFIALAPADIITLDDARLRIISVQLEAGYQSIRAVYDRQSAYYSTIKGIPKQEATTPPDLTLANTLFHVFEAPPLNDAHDTLGYYVAVTPEGMNWQGAQVDLSRDGVTFVESEEATHNATFGQLTAPLAFHRHEYRDDLNTLYIELVREDMELLPATQGEMQNRMNLALVGDEIIAFSGVNQVADKEWELTGLLRGRKQTIAVNHLAGERFILLDDQVQFVPAQQFDLGRDLTFRATSYGAEPQTTGWQSLTLYGIKEPAPAYLKARRTGNNLVISWQGIGRRGGGAAVSLSAGFKHYRVTRGGQSWDTAESTLTIPYSAGTVTVQQVHMLTGAGLPASIAP